MKTSWNKGIKASEETKQKMREARLKNPVSYWKGKKLSKEHKKLLSLSKIGNKNALGSIRTKKHKEAIRQSILGNKNPAKKPEVRKKISLAKTGISTMSEKGKQKLREIHTGANCFFWKGGISNNPYPLDFTNQLKKTIRQRDNWTCFMCKEHGTAVHHIDYNKNNICPNNLITLCKTCHGKTNHYREYWIEYFKKKRNPQQN